MSDYSGYLGYVRITGAGIEDGVIGARNSGLALIGMEEALKYFIKKTDNDFAPLDFSIPVRVRKGSWEALIPHTIEQWLTDAMTLGVVNYIRVATTTLAKNDFSDKDMGRIVRASLAKFKSVIKITKHVGKVGSHKIEGIKFEGNWASVPGEDGTYLHVTRQELETYLKCPETLLSNLVEAIQKDQVLAVADIDDKGNPEEEKVEYSDRDKFVYKPGDEEADMLFPELKHGSQVELVGFVTRGNKNSNTIGFEYKHHILTCYPKRGNIVDYKEGLFKTCAITGIISRTADPMLTDGRRPKIVFSALMPLDEEDSNTQATLL